MTHSELEDEGLVSSAQTVQRIIGLRLAAPLCVIAPTSGPGRRSLVWNPLEDDLNVAGEHNVEDVQGCSTQDLRFVRRMPQCF